MVHTGQIFFELSNAEVYFIHKLKIKWTQCELFIQTTKTWIIQQKHSRLWTSFQVRRFPIKLLFRTNYFLQWKIDSDFMDIFHEWIQDEKMCKWRNFLREYLFINYCLCHSGHICDPNMWYFSTFFSGKPKELMFF